MFDKLLSLLAPHLCYECSQKGYVLCDSCVYNYTLEPETGCISCGLPCVDGVCKKCVGKLSYSKAWQVGSRQGVLKNIINDYKFERLYAAHQVLARLLDETLPVLPSETVIVPIPTVPAHIRLRGYDHTLLVAKALAQRRGLTLEKLIKRKTNTIQTGAARQLRKRQAKEAFYIDSAVNHSAPHLIIDDITTTGATLNAAAHCLKNTGIKEVWVAVIARQPREK